MTTPKNKAAVLPIAVFITPHGFGHAARAAAVMLELHRLIPETVFHIYTKTPPWFFAESRLDNFVYHEVATDLGLVQRNALQEDLPATIQRLESFLPFDPAWVRALAEDVRANGCKFVLCDIAPLGIAVAEQLGLPSLLEENFTWDWIYAGYPAYHEALAPFIHDLADWFARATYHIQTRPVSYADASFPAVNPVSRPIRQPRPEIRRRLQIDPEVPTVLVTMGGIENGHQKWDSLKTFKEALFVIPGASSGPTRDGNLYLLPHHHGIYHPDLLNACDAVVGKLGYSTLAECYAAGAAFGFIPRLHFPESAMLRQFGLTAMHGLEISEEEYANEAWLQKVPALLAQPRDERDRTNGAGEIARFIQQRVLGQS